ncbi:MAG: hypothetical protein L6V88_05660 [Anaerotruncus sp.]|nr:MAG: hypothetical protein L6V88_05660 [Anaerotruncus sp.]
MTVLFPFVIEYFEKIHQQNIIGEQEILRNKMDYNQMMMLKDEKNKDTEKNQTRFLQT